MFSEVKSFTLSISSSSSSSASRSSSSTGVNKGFPPAKAMMAYFFYTEYFLGYLRQGSLFTVF